jgi:hypothetical protein
VLVAVTLAVVASGWRWPLMLQALTWAVVCSTLVSGAAYVWMGVRVR